MFLIPMSQLLAASIYFSYKVNISLLSLTLDAIMPVQRTSDITTSTGQSLNFVVHKAVINLVYLNF